MLGYVSSFDFDAALAYLKLLFVDRGLLTSRISLDRHSDKLFFRGKVRDRFLRNLPPGVAYLADKRPGNHWVPTWKLMVPEALSPSRKDSVRT